MNLATPLLAVFLVVSQGSNVVVPLTRTDIMRIDIASNDVSKAQRWLTMLQETHADPKKIAGAAANLAGLQRELYDLEYQTIQQLRPKRLPQPECEGIRAWFSPDGKFHEELRHNPKGYIGHIEGKNAIYEKGFLDCHSE